jgi:hypothetical protein
MLNEIKARVTLEIMTENDTFLQSLPQSRDVKDIAILND